MNFQMQSKRVLDNSSMSPDFRAQTPKHKRRMHHENEIAFGPVTTIDMTVIDRKIHEVEQLLNELYALREYFEQKNRATREIPNYFT
jgi:hypothetical protein